MAIKAHPERLFEQLKRMIPNIPDECRAVTIRIAAGEAPTIQCEMFATAESVQPTTKIFELVEKAEKESDVTECS